MTFFFGACWKSVLWFLVFGHGLAAFVSLLIPLGTFLLPKVKGIVVEVENSTEHSVLTIAHRSDLASDSIQNKIILEDSVIGYKVGDTVMLGSFSGKHFVIDTGSYVVPLIFSLLFCAIAAFFFGILRFGRTCGANKGVRNLFYEE